MENHERKSDMEIQLLRKELTDRVNKNHEEVMSILNPIADTYKTAGTIAKWFMATTVFLGVFVGLLVGLKDLFKR